MAAIRKFEDTQTYANIGQQYALQNKKEFSIHNFNHLKSHYQFWDLSKLNEFINIFPTSKNAIFKTAIKLNLSANLHNKETLHCSISNLISFAGLSKSGAARARTQLLNTPNNLVIKSSYNEETKDFLLGRRFEISKTCFKPDKDSITKQRLKIPNSILRHISRNKDLNYVDIMVLLYTMWLTQYGEKPYAELKAEQASKFLNISVSYLGKSLKKLKTLEIIESININKNKDTVVSNILNKRTVIFNQSWFKDKMDEREMRSINEVLQGKKELVQFGTGELVQFGTYNKVTSSTKVLTYLNENISSITNLKEKVVSRNLGFTAGYVKAHFEESILKPYEESRQEIGFGDSKHDIHLDDILHLLKTGVSLNQIEAALNYLIKNNKKNLNTMFSTQLRALSYSLKKKQIEQDLIEENRHRCQDVQRDLKSLINASETTLNMYQSDYWHFNKEPDKNLVTLDKLEKLIKVESFRIEKANNLNNKLEAQIQDINKKPMEEKDMVEYKKQIWSLQNHLIESRNEQNLIENKKTDKKQAINNIQDMQKLLVN